MKRTSLIAAVSLILIVNAAVLATVWRNRSGEPEAILHLTERELSLDYDTPEDSSLSLTIQWSMDPASPDWFTAEKLASVGFDLSLPLEAPQAELFYGKMLSRQVYAVVEYEGEGWHHWQEKEEALLQHLRQEVARGEEKREYLQRQQERYEENLQTMSRLFIIDVGRNPQELRQRYPDRSHILIAPALVSIEYTPASHSRREPLRPASISGRVRELLPEELQVPLPLRHQLDPLVQRIKEARSRSDFNRQTVPIPAFEADICYGRRLEPWLSRVAPLME
jgi:Fe-S cluster biosynthesis and repair protein YggX